MKIKTLLIVSVIIAFITICCVYIYGLATMWNLNPKDKSPFYITKEPIIVKNIMLPKGAKIIYEKRFFWQKYEQEKLLSEKNITAISFEKATTIYWGGVPISSIIKFYNSEMSGYSVYPNFNKLNQNKATEFSNLWQSCDDDLGISVINTNDWSFNKKNILDIESCGVSYQRYFNEKIEQQRFLDNLYNELKKIND